MTPEQVPALLRRVMQCVDPAERMCLLIEAFESVDASNVEAVFLAFDSMRQESGHDHGAEYRMAAYVAGKRTGGAMMDSWMKQGFKKNIDAAHESFFGWATQNPKDAEVWLDGIATEYPAEKSRLVRALIGGMAIHNPDEAIAKLATIQEPERSASVGDLCFHMVQGEGIDRAIDWMLKVRSSATPENQAYVETVSRDVTRKLIWSGMGGNGADETAARLERLNSSEPLEPGIVRTALAQMPGSESLDMLDRLSAGAILADPESHPDYSQIAVTSALRKDSQGVMKWLQTHPTSPIYESVAFSACKVLSDGGRADELQQHLASITNVALREKIETALRN